MINKNNRNNICFYMRYYLKQWRIEGQFPWYQTSAMFSSLSQWKSGQKDVHKKNISVCSAHHKRCRESKINIWWSWLDFLLILCKYLTWNLKLQIFSPGDVGHIIMKLILVDDILLQMENRILVLLFFLTSSPRSWGSM